MGDLTQRQAAKVAGFGLLFMFISGIFASSIDATSMYEKYRASSGMLRMNIVGDIMMLVFDVVAALGLYVFLKPVNKSLSMLAAWFRLIHVAIYGVVGLNLLMVLYLLSGAESLSGFSQAQLQSQTMLFLTGHEYGFKIGLVFFGFHFLVLGYLVIKSTFIPKVLGILLLVVSVGYLFNSLAGFLMPAFDDYKSIIQTVAFIPAIIAELSLCLWLLIRGGRIPKA